MFWRSDLGQDIIVLLLFSRRYGCTGFEAEAVVSGLKDERAQVKDILRAGDTLVVWRLDRLGRSLRDLIDWVTYLDESGIGLRSLQEAIDTTTPTGKLTFHIFGALAEFERTLIRDRTQAGLVAARARGRKGGHPQSLDSDKRALAVRLYEERQMPIAKICAMMGISKPTLYSYVRAADPAKSEGNSA